MKDIIFHIGNAQETVLLSLYNYAMHDRNYLVVIYYIPNVNNTSKQLNYNWDQVWGLLQYEDLWDTAI